MNDFNTSIAQGRTMDASVNLGLRSFMLGVYNKLALGIALSGLIAYIAGSVAPVSALVYTAPMIYIVMFAPVALILGSMMMIVPSRVPVGEWSISPVGSMAPAARWK